MMLAALMLALCGFASADADPVRVSSLSEPQSVISEQDVSITIKIYNSSQSDMQGDITLYNPDRISVEKYSGLKGEQSVTYTGKWHVTREQIEEGKIKYYVKYPVTADGETKDTVRVIPVTIQAEAAKKKEEEAAAAEPPAPPAPSAEEVLLTEIRDLLKNK